MYEGVKLVKVGRGVRLSMPNIMHMAFHFKTRLLSKTLSHMWGKLNLPIFLFNVGLLTLINIDSLMVLANSCPPCLLFGSYTDW